MFRTGNENASSENFVKSCSAFVISTAFEWNHTATEFLTTQNDQSKRDILIDYVLSGFKRPPVQFCNYSQLFPS